MNMQVQLIYIIPIISGFFAGTTNQLNLSVGNQDLLRVEFITEGVTYNQISDLRASQQIRLFGGTWNSNWYNVHSGKLFFNDGIPSNGTHLTKVFNTSGSNILCEEWDSRNTYGSNIIEAPLFQHFLNRTEYFLYIFHFKHESYQ